MTERRRWPLVFLACFALTLVLYRAVWPGIFLADDRAYLLNNPAITGTSSPLSFWTSLSQPDYWPLSYTAYWLLYRVCGENPLGYLLVNLALHALNASLVYALAQRLTPRGALFAALLFLAHPLHVQAVAWAFQLKTLLATALALASLLVFLRPSEPARGWNSILSLALFSLALLAKTSVVTLPLALPFLARLRGKRGPVVSALFFFVPAALLGAVTLYLNAGLVPTPGSAPFFLPWTERPLLALSLLGFYLTKFIYPHPLAFLYPLRPDAITPSLFGVGMVGGTLLSVFLVRRNRSLAALPAAYLLTLIPALGFVLIPGMRLTLAADHWAYFPDVFLCLAVGAAATALPRVLARASYAGPLVYGALTLHHASHFASEETLWRQAGRVNPGSATVDFNLGTVYEATGRKSEAIEAYRRALAEDSSHGRAAYNLGVLLVGAGQPREAAAALRTALASGVRSPTAYWALAQCTHFLGNDDEAVRVAHAGLALFPRDPELLAFVRSLGIPPGRNGSE